jgi:hypothetical protein
MRIRTAATLAEEQRHNAAAALRRLNETLHLQR